jgi:hypothetical protein
VQLVAIRGRVITLPMQTRFFQIALVAIGSIGSASAQQSYTFTTFDYPAAAVTNINAIDSSGNVVGHATLSQNGSLHGVGFLRLASGKVVTLTDPKSVQSTYANGISDTGAIVGGYTNGNNQGYGFYLSKTTGYLTVNKGTNTELTGISTNGLIVGRYTSGNIMGFVQTAAGKFQVLPDLNGLPVEPLGINSSDVIVGGDEVSILAGITTDGFILEPGGTYQIVDYPGAFITTLNGINNTGVAVGTYTKSVNGMAEGGGFIYSQGVFTDFSYQGSTTYPNGINADGAIVGTYYDANSRAHGFIATPMK